MAEAVLAAGVLGFAGWGIYRRSVAVAEIADRLPLPIDLEVISRQWIFDQVTAPNSPITELLGADLTKFFSDTGWVGGATVVPPLHADDVATIGGVLWPFARLIQATALNLMVLVNDAQARVTVPPIPDAKIGTHVSFFDLSATAPVFQTPTKGKSVDEIIADDVERIETWLRKAIPIPPGLLKQPPDPAT